MTITTHITANELFCLMKKGYTPERIVMGNSVHSLGILTAIASSFKLLPGGEIEAMSQFLEAGRSAAYQRMIEQVAKQQPGYVIGVTNELIVHPGTIEFLAKGSVLKSSDAERKTFSTPANGKQLYALSDAGYQPIRSVFGTIAYSMALGRGLFSRVKTLARGEKKDYTAIFNDIRHKALERLTQQAKQQQANAVLGIETMIVPFGGVCEMLMTGTASYHPALAAAAEPVTSDMSPVEMWAMTKMGYAPVQLVLSTAIYSMGFVASMKSVIKNFFHSEMKEMTQLTKEAREKAIADLNEKAKLLGADTVIGIKSRVYPLGNGLFEFLCLGTAVKKMPGMQTASDLLPMQAGVYDADSYYDATAWGHRVNIHLGRKPISTFLTTAFWGMIAFLAIMYLVKKHFWIF